MTPVRRVEAARVEDDTVHATMMEERPVFCVGVIERVMVVVFGGLKPEVAFLGHVP